MPGRHAAPMEDGPVELPDGKMVGRRWKVLEKLGEGGCGAVYLVEDSKSQAKAALKAESNFVPGGSVLKLEVQVLRRLEGRKYVAQLICSGKKQRYCYMVMTLFGYSLSRLFKQCKKRFTPSTQVRLGLQMLYGLKQLHEVGFVHRDLKPANLAIGRKPKSCKVVHLLDFGLSREFIIAKEDGKHEIRNPRARTLFRGTTKYCSCNSHAKAEQGRPDDLWSMVFVLAEMSGPLPWEGVKDKNEIGKIKRATSDETLLAKSPPQFSRIAQHLRELDYFKRPDYALIFSIFDEMMVELNVKHMDPLDWELLPNKQQKLSLSPVATPQRKIRTMDESTEKNQISKDGPTLLSVDYNDDPPFTKDVFERNELGF